MMNRDYALSVGSVAFANANNENPTPLGSGLLVLVAAGAGYVTLKKKEAPVGNNTNGGGTRITLNVTSGQNDGKSAFTPATTSFVWSNGATEYINVGGSTGGYLGQLTGTGNGTASISFSGTLTTDPVEGETLYFFYLGNGDHAAATTVDFSNQPGNLDEVTDFHVAVGSATYSSSASSYSATLSMLMSIAYFDMSEFGSENVYLYGDDIYSSATIDYKTGTITGVKGSISMGTAGSAKYVALVPSTKSATTLNFASASYNGSMTFNNGIQDGRYYSNEGAALEVTASSAINSNFGQKVFSVSATKKGKICSRQPAILERNLEICCQSV